VSDGEVLYEAPLRRRTAVTFGVVFASSFLVAGLVGIVEGSPYDIATILGVVFLFGFAFVVYLLTPTRIEVRADDVRLIAPRTTTKYVGSAMTLSMRPDGGWQFARREPPRTLAYFRDPDVDRVKQAFGQAGVAVVGI
jgi:hypothetical protein